MKGIILAGDNGSGFYPATRSTNKHLLPLYDKPLIYYTLSTLMTAGIREILIVCKAFDIAPFRRLLGDGSHWGIWISYKVESSTSTLPQAILLGREFAPEGPLCVIAGDNVFLGKEFASALRNAASRKHGATVFLESTTTSPAGTCHAVTAVTDNTGRLTGLSSSSADAPGVQAITGLYFLDDTVRQLARNLPATSTSDALLSCYLKRKQLFAIPLGKTTTWFAPRNAADFLNAAQTIRQLAMNDDVHAGFLEEVAHEMGFIDSADLENLARRAGDSLYAASLRERLLTRKAA